jgi:hypothetical protein
MSGVDLEAMGLIEKTEEPVEGQESPEADPMRIIMDSLLVSLQERDKQIAALAARLSQAEKYISYLLTQDPGMSEKMKALAASTKDVQAHEKAQ